MDSVRSGMGLIVWSIYLAIFMFVGVICLTGVAIVAPPLALFFVPFALAMPFVVLAMVLLGVVGKIQCLQAPAGAGQAFIFGSLACSALDVVLSFLKMNTFANGLEMLGMALFVMFLSSLATYIGRQDLAAQASSVLVLFVAGALLSMLGGVLGLLGLLGSIVSLVALFRFLGTIFAIRGALG